MMAEANHTSQAPVVEQVKMPKMKVDGSKIAYVNAFATAGAIFFGVAAIFNAIAGFTKGKWIFEIPFDNILGSFSNSMYSYFFMGILTFVLGLVSFLTVGKITDAGAITKAWKFIFKVNLVLLVLFAIDMISMILTSLIGIGKTSSVYQSQGTLWLSGFLPTVIMALVAGVIAFVAKSIASGKTQLLRIMTLVALGVGSVAMIMVFISQIVGMYAKKSSYSDYLDDIDDYLDWLK